MFATLTLSVASSAIVATTKMAPTAATTTVEHVVLFKVCDSTDSSKIDAMISILGFTHLYRLHLPPCRRLDPPPLASPTSSTPATAPRLTSPPTPCTPPMWLSSKGGRRRERRAVGSPPWKVFRAWFRLGGVPITSLDLGHGRWPHRHQGRHPVGFRWEEEVERALETLPLCGSQTGSRLGPSASLSQGCEQRPPSALGEHPVGSSQPEVADRATGIINHATRRRERKREREGGPPAAASTGPVTGRAAAWEEASDSLRPPAHLPLVR